jgi:hypothetical protein
MPCDGSPGVASLGNESDETEVAFRLHSGPRPSPAVGARKAGSETPIQVDDGRLHLGDGSVEFVVDQ